MAGFPESRCGDDRGLGFRRLRSGADFLLQPVVALLQRREIGQDQLGVDDFDVAHGIDCAADVMDVAVLEAAHHLHDGVHFADVAEELVAEALARARPFHEPGDIDELDRGRNDFLRMRKLGENLEPRVGHGHDAEIRIDRAERVVRRLRLAGAGDGVEESGFANVRQPDDSGAKHKKIGPARFELATS